MRAGSATFQLQNCIGDRAIVAEVFEHHVYRYHPRPNHVVVDIGAHRGVFSVWCAMRGALVFAYEPCKDSFEDLLANIRTNGVVGRVEPRNLAIWSKACSLPLYYWPQEAGGHSLVETKREASEEVLCTTLDDAFTYIRWCDFLKIDVEGAELEILQYVSDSVLDRVAQMSVEIHSPALDPGGREHPVKFTAYSDERYQQVRARMTQHFEQIEELRARNGDVNYLYCRKVKSEQW